MGLPVRKPLFVVAIALAGCGEASEPTRIERAVKRNPYLPPAQVKSASCHRTRDAWACSIKLRSGEAVGCTVSGPTKHVESTCIR